MRIPELNGFSIPVALADRLAELSLFPDRAERIEYLIEISRKYDAQSAILVPRDDSHRVPGCESEVFVDVVSDPVGGLKFLFAVDNPQGLSAMALAVILSSGLEGAKKEEILAVSEDIVFQIFGNELSMGKSLGLTNMVRMVKHLATNR